MELILYCQHFEDYATQEACRGSKKLKNTVLKFFYIWFWTSIIYPGSFIYFQHIFPHFTRICFCNIFIAVNRFLRSSRTLYRLVSDWHGDRFFIRYPQILLLHVNCFISLSLFNFSLSYSLWQRCSSGLNILMTVVDKQIVLKATQDPIVNLFFRSVVSDFVFTSLLINLDHLWHWLESSQTSICVFTS